MLSEPDAAEINDGLSENAGQIERVAKTGISDIGPGHIVSEFGPFRSVEREMSIDIIGAAAAWRFKDTETRSNWPNMRLDCHFCGPRDGGNYRQICEHRSLFALMLKKHAFMVHTVDIIPFDDVEVLDFAGPSEGFSIAGVRFGSPARQIRSKSWDTAGSTRRGGLWKRKFGIQAHARATKCFRSFVMLLLPSAPAFAENPDDIKQPFFYEAVLKY